jgi:hypothetical protein
MRLDGLEEALVLGMAGSIIEAIWAIV